MTTLDLKKVNMGNFKYDKNIQDDIKRIYDMSRTEEILLFQKETILYAPKRKIINNKLNIGKLKTKSK